MRLLILATFLLVPGTFVWLVSRDIQVKKGIACSLYPKHCPTIDKILEFKGGKHHER